MINPVMKSDHSASLLWLALILSIGLAIAFLLPVTPNDYWWYLRLGQDTIAAGAVPQTDNFTYNQAGSPVVYHSWGSAVLFYLLYKTGSLPLTVFMRGLLVTIAGILLWLIARKKGAGRIGGMLVLLLVILTSSNNWSMRPQLFAYPLFALSLYILYRWMGGERRIVYWLPLISLVWVNLHGSFVILVLLTGAALAFSAGDTEEKSKGSRSTMAVAFAGILLATLFNPRGLGAWTYVFQSLTIPSSQLFSAEWLPPVNDHWQMNIFFLWLLLFPLLVAFSTRKLSWLEWVWFLGFGILALMGERYVIWFIYILSVLTAYLLSDWEQRLVGEPKPGSSFVNRLIAVVLILLPLGLLPVIRDSWWHDAPDVTENTPIAATRWLSTHPELPGPLWSEIGFSSYLEFALPERPIWIDTRFEVFPVQQWQDYKDITNASFRWNELLDETGANLLMVSLQNQPALISALTESPQWCEQYQDNTALIYQRCEGK